MAGKFFTVSEAAELIGVPVSTVRRWCAYGRLPSSQGVAGGKRVIHADALRDAQEWIGSELRMSRMFAEYESAPRGRVVRYVSVATVAKLLEVDVRTVRRWCASGKLPAVRGVERGPWKISCAELMESYALDQYDFDDSD